MTKYNVFSCMEEYRQHCDKCDEIGAATFEYGVADVVRDVVYTRVDMFVKCSRIQTAAKRCASSGVGFSS